MSTRETTSAITAKMASFLEAIKPGFVHAREEPHEHEGWRRLTFPSGVQCVTHTVPIETEYLYNELFETRVYADELIDITDGDTIVDVGAHIGLFSMSVLMDCPGVRVHAIEPVPQTFEVLKENLSRFPGSEVQLHNVGLGATDGERATLSVYPLWLANTTSHPHIHDQQREGLAAVFTPEELEEAYGTALSITVPITTLSALIRTAGVETVDLLKINTEGAEIDILNGIESADWKRIQQVCMEVHDEVRTLSSVVEILEGNGLSSRVREDTREAHGTVIVVARRT